MYEVLDFNQWLEILLHLYPSTKYIIPKNLPRVLSNLTLIAEQVQLINKHNISAPLFTVVVKNYDLQKEFDQLLRALIYFESHKIPYRHNLQLSASLKELAAQLNINLQLNFKQKYKQLNSSNTISPYFALLQVRDKPHICKFANKNEFLNFLEEILAGDIDNECDTIICAPDFLPRIDILEEPLVFVTNNSLITASGLNLNLPNFNCEIINFASDKDILKILGV